jgi:cytoskeletal protein CcmA (bactofilin family)
MESTSQTADESAPQTRSNRYRSEPPSSPALTVTPAPSGAALALGPRDSLVGKLVYEGDVRVQGTLEGEAAVTGDLNVEGQGTVKAKVEARNVSVRGTLNGEATARERLLIAGSGVVSGTIKVARLQIEDGALFNGTITMDRSGGASANGKAQSDG